jgi:glycosyltransferase involved in cell wall biosynthesis
LFKPRSLTSLSLFFPCHNEAGNVGPMIEQAVSTAESYGVDYEVIVVDDGSRDETAKIAESYSARNPRVRLVRHPKNLGYGAALRSGFAAATKDLVFLTDGDGQFHIADIEKLFSKIDSCDVVTGYRLERRDAPHRRLNGWIWTRLSRLLFGLGVRDVDCAFKLFRAKALKGLVLRSNQLLIHAEILARLKKRGCKIQEIGVTHHPRTAGKASATSPGRMARSVVELIKLYWNIRFSQ